MMVRYTRLAEIVGLYYISSLLSTISVVQYYRGVSQLGCIYRNQCLARLE